MAIQAIKPLFTWSEFVSSLRDAQLNHPTLKPVQLAQAIIESGRGSSRLYAVAGNPYGMKWRPEMQGNMTGRIALTTPTESQPVEWVLWRTPRAAAVGYWQFINRPPYQGWQQYQDDPLRYLQHLHQCGYATDPAYVRKVWAAVPEARQLLSK